MKSKYTRIDLATIATFISGVCFEIKSVAVHPSVLRKQENNDVVLLLYQKNNCPSDKPLHYKCKEISTYYFLWRNLLTKFKIIKGEVIMEKAINVLTCCLLALLLFLLGLNIFYRSN